MADHVANRETMIEALRRELVGPAPAGVEKDISQEIRLESFKDLDVPYRQQGSGEEILTRDAPTKRYGVAVLYPWRAPLEEGRQASDTEDDNGSLEMVEEAEEEEKDAPPPPEVEVKIGSERDTEDFDLSLANAYQPSSMGVSFLAQFPEGSSLMVEVSGGRYDPKTIHVRGRDGAWVQRDWWLRKPVSFRAIFPASDLMREARLRLVAALPGKGGTHTLSDPVNLEEMDLRVEVVARQQEEAQERLLTVCVVNYTRGMMHFGPNRECLFQTTLTARVVAPMGGAHILPYPSADLTDMDEENETEDARERRGLDLLYREAQTFATGHGCAADWELASRVDRATWAGIACLPRVETPGVTPDIRREDGTKLEVSMRALAGLDPEDDGWRGMEEVVARYEGWIAEREREAKGLAERYQRAADDHLARCKGAATRMRAGLAYLREDAKTRQAFQLANHAILLQQIVGNMWRGKSRSITYDPKQQRLVFSEAYQAPDPRNGGMWRPFQIGFLLASVHSTADGGHDDRELVELIWFPTGGGKTEAYLGLAAFAMFRRRLDKADDDGVSVLMRYTLRLLTAQQFQRASGLTCAMEYLRRDRERELGTAPFSIGIWLGGSTTPNTRDQAVAALQEMEKWKWAANRFVLSQCPWCGAAFGTVEMGHGGKYGKAKNRVVGYERYAVPGTSETTVRLLCPDQRCPFSTGLPVFVTDEDIYDIRPSLVIGTIDKFAMLAWRPKARTLFGFDADGNRICSPPGLIIQDELHLIAGPLGSLAGLYEVAIEDFCTDHRGETAIRPKIVSSTATIRSYREQIRGLYARKDVVLFPPPGLSAGDSFFARYDRSQRGRVYVGVHAASLGSVQTEWVRTLTALSQSPMAFDTEGRDPWWTMLTFFNSLREMGTAHTLFDSDIPDYQEVIWKREGTGREGRRYLRTVRELTGGLPSEEITGAIRALETGTKDEKRRPIDVCLASNIIEVGIDIPRLSLMVVAGQPKSTAQYIQVTGRVGRLADRPGLVVTMYSPSKPRDRSHFERFRGYHEQLYAHVEPTSVTPFSAPVLDRALHAALVAYARQQGGKQLAANPYPYPKDEVERFAELLRWRVAVVDPDERENLERAIKERASEWHDWHRTRWDGQGSEDDIPLLRVAGEYVTAKARRLSWPTLMSMRNVDAECEAKITTDYLTQGDSGNA